MFEVGDFVVHPTRGAGLVVGFDNFERQEGEKRYYVIELMGVPDTQFMLPVNSSEADDLRPPIPLSTLQKVWHILASAPQPLPSNHKRRYRVLHNKLEDGDPIDIAETVRDMAGRQRQEKGLTTRGKRIYDRVMTFLTTEIAAAQHNAIEEVENQVRKKLREGIPRAN